MAILGFKNKIDFWRKKGGVGTFGRICFFKKHCAKWRKFWRKNSAGT
jgi:hypothetical protein